MGTPTANYGFVKDAPTQNYDVNVVNANLDAIDAAIKARADAISTTNGNVTALTTRVTALETKQYALLRPNAAQSYGNNVSGQVALQTNVASAGLTVVLGASASLKVTNPGIYVISAGLTWAVGTVAGTRQLQININGNVVSASAIAGYSGGFNINNCSIVIPLVLDDIITLEAVQTSGASLNTGPTDRSFLSCSRLSAA